MPILHIAAAEVVGQTSLYVEFDDGLSGTVDLRPILRGPVFKPLFDPNFFARCYLDPECGTVCWPNGADLAPEAVRALLPTPANAPGKPSDSSKSASRAF
ncbi:MAG: DUF2442 domain-containing protein [Planctomycetota bacterium]